MYGIYLLAAKKAGKKDHFAFGPFLCAGIVIAMLFGGRFGMVLRVFVKFRPSKNCILALLRV